MTHLHATLEYEFQQCWGILERLHVAELRRLLRQFNLYPNSVPEIQFIVDEAQLYKSFMQREVITAQEQLQCIQSQNTTQCRHRSCHHSNCSGEAQ
jgi:hypothetical protein